jgi:HD-like signal output (HDOD) protein
MLHEIGVLVIEASLPPAQLARLCDDPRRGWSFARRVEREVLGTDHAMLGGALASHWGLPSLVVDAIVHHHDPHAVAAPHHALAACAVSVADMVAVTIGAGLGAREENPVDEGSALPHLGLTGDDFSALCTEVYDELEDALVRFE